MDSTNVVEVVTPIFTIGGLTAIVSILAFAASELMPFLPTKSNGVIQLVINLLKKVIAVFSKG